MSDEEEAKGGEKDDWIDRSDSDESFPDVKVPDESDDDDGSGSSSDGDVVVDYDRSSELWTDFVKAFTTNPSKRTDECQAKKRRIESFYDTESAVKKWRAVKKSLKIERALSDPGDHEPSNAQKNSTLEKAREEWNQFKRQNEIEADEMVEHNKSKKGYLERMEFLSRVDAKKDEIEREKRAEAARKRMAQQDKKMGG
ncbi:hypothetical protein ACOME3_000972 [Neoechinorhynchus agilis]